MGDLSSSSSSCAGCSLAEPKIQGLLEQISISFSTNPSKFLGFDFPPPQSDSGSGPIDCSALVRRWLGSVESSKFPLCPNLKKQIEALVFNLLLNETRTKKAVRMGSMVISNSNSDLRRKKRGRSGDGNNDDGDGGGLADMLNKLKCVAVDPCDDEINAEKEWKGRVRRTRKAMFIRADDVPDPADFPYRKKQKSHKFLSAADGDLHSLRRSQRKILKLGNNELLRIRIPIGPIFQVDVPEWTGPIMEDADNSKWLGTQIWPMADGARQIKKETRRSRKRLCISPKEMFSNGRSYLCGCMSPGSVACVRFHVNTSRLQLKSDLGPAFFSMGFAEMGEEVSKLWTQEEQLKFDDIVRQNPSLEDKSFLEPALRHFASKSRKDIVSYYFNVFILRWMSIRTRSEARTVDTSDDESFGWDEQNCQGIKQTS